MLNQCYLDSEEFTGNDGYREPDGLYGDGAVAHGADRGYLEVNNQWRRGDMGYLPVAPTQGDAVDAQALYDRAGAGGAVGMYAQRHPEAAYDNPRALLADIRGEQTEFVNPAFEAPYDVATRSSDPGYRQVADLLKNKKKAKSQYQHVDALPSIPSEMLSHPDRRAVVEVMNEYDQVRRSVRGRPSVHGGNLYGDHAVEDDEEGLYAETGYASVPKWVARDADLPRVDLDEVQYHAAEGGQEPIPIASFEHANLKLKRANQLLNIKMFEGSTARTASQRVMVAETEQLTYQGAAESNGLLQPRYLLARRSADGKTLDLYDARVFRLQPVLKDSESEKNTRTLDSGERVMQARADLTETFGGKKKKAQLHALERNKFVFGHPTFQPCFVTASLTLTHCLPCMGLFPHAPTHRIDSKALAAVGGVMYEALSKPMDIDSDPAKQDQDRFRPVPQYDPAATVPADVYPLKHLISHADASAVAELCKPFTAADEQTVAKWKATNKFSPLVFDGLDLLVTKSGSAKKMLARVLQYLVELLKFYNYVRTHRKIVAIEVKEELQSVPPAIIDSFMDKFVFSDSTGQTPSVRENGANLSKRNMHLLIHHLLVLAFHARGFSKLSSARVAEALSMAPATAVTHLKAIGCKCSAVKATPQTAAYHVAELVAPLQFPKVKRGPPKAPKVDEAEVQAQFDAYLSTFDVASVLTKESKEAQDAVAEQLAKFDSFWKLAALRSRDYDLELAAKVLTNYIKWRKDFRVDEITVDNNAEFRALIEMNSVVLAGNHAKEGSLAIVVRPRRNDLTRFTPEDILRAMHLAVEYGLRRFPEVAQSKGFAVIMDVTNASSSQLDRRIPQNLGPAVSYAWPIKISAIYVVSMPFFFRMIFPIVKMFFEERLRNMITVLPGGPDQLSQYFDLDQLEEDQGGSYQFDAEDYIAYISKMQAASDAPNEAE
ncbi:uncharacterized protein MONBRDRAFT_31562 [Monosiga brevicollis MX1]|uniref:CRAL-TRIO domain-containing protein n=1 Tax=Monosiga brevicollis TaxID=81824 RepID=A9UTZ6_MONBE|nr:uncharacterized protein MONBRDRAFT_31562 [Monosiga brevicollis MX1]EDQ91332.1 predicted protein [Monosiga brevicollis MX1]|eukprot:XP_001743754.1 hypothetical protein [Monosiga brevicollis MX1]